MIHIGIFVAHTTLREDIFAEDIFVNRGSLSCEFRGRYFCESRIESQFRGRYFREIRTEGQFREKFVLTKTDYSFKLFFNSIVIVVIIEERMFSEKNSDIFSTVLNLRVF